jgi:adenosylcobinamide-phosphate guanylyltransferase
MDALIMAGGRGTRLKLDVEKPLLEFEGKPLVEYVLTALRGARSIERIFAATTAHTPGTAQLLRRQGVEIVSTPGRGYVADLRYAVEALELGVVMVVVSDLPLLRTQEIEEVAREYRRRGSAALATMVPLEVFHRYGLTPTLVIRNLVPAGVNVINARRLDGKEEVYITENIRLAVNVNSLGDLRKAEEIRRILNADKQRTP